MSMIDTSNKEALYGSVYFVVGRGTEGGAASFRLAIAGITVGAKDPYWGKPEEVIENSGYSLGAIQVDLGQRGTWPLGATSGRSLAGGERTYVDSIIEEASSYAESHDLPFTADLASLRNDLLSHGNGLKGRQTIRFIDEDTRDSINAWASSGDGKRWIHKNMDYAQVRNSVDIATTLLEKYDHNIAPEYEFQTICLLAKTANQMPGLLRHFEKVLREGGNYDEVVNEAERLHQRKNSYGGPIALDVAGRFLDSYQGTAKKEALDRAAVKVSQHDYDPSKERGDGDISEALSSIGRQPRTSAQSHSHSSLLQRGDRGEAISALQHQLNQLGYGDGQGNPLPENQSYGPLTEAAVRQFQADHDLHVDGRVGPVTSKALTEKIQALGTEAQQEKPFLQCPARLDDTSHPDFRLFQEARDQVYAMDSQHGRASNQQSDNLASALVVAARSEGMQRIDIVALSDDASKVWAVQRPPGVRDSFFDQYANVGTVSALNTSMEQSGALWPQAMQQFQQHQDAQAVQQAPLKNQTQDQQGVPAIHR